MQLFHPQKSHTHFSATQTRSGRVKLSRFRTWSTAADRENTHINKHKLCECMCVYLSDRGMFSLASSMQIRLYTNAAGWCSCLSVQEQKKRNANWCSSKYMQKQFFPEFVVFPSFPTLVNDIHLGASDRRGSDVDGSKQSAVQCQNVAGCGSHDKGEKTWSNLNFDYSRMVFIWGWRAVMALSLY